MTIYWSLLAFTVLLALAFPANEQNQRLGAGQTLALIAFLFFYVAVATARYEIGGDWGNYVEIYDWTRTVPLGEALAGGDPLFMSILWVSGRLGLGVYPANGICAALIAFGALRLALRAREPWLALTIAVPYLLIVVGMGYIRQAAAIGLIMMAAADLGRQRRWRTILELALAVGFHATAAIILPFFALALVRRNTGAAVVVIAVGAVLIVALLQRLPILQVNYFEAQYDSDGATVRVLMNALPSLFVLLRARRLPFQGAERNFWLLVAAANLVGLLALILSPSSTAVDRVALYFAPIQLVAFGNALRLSGFSARHVHLVRIAAVVVAALVQVVWLLLATNAPSWVPYRSVLELV